MSLKTVRSRVALAPPGSCDVALVNWATIYLSLEAWMVRTVHSHHATPRIVIESARRFIFVLVPPCKLLKRSKISFHWPGSRIRTTTQAQARDSGWRLTIRLWCFGEGRSIGC